MAVTGTQVASLSSILLLDEGATRWTNTELFGWIKEGRREMAVRKPSVFGKQTRATHTLTSGCYQQLSVAGAFAIASVDSNVSSGRAIRLATREQLDAFKPTWVNDTGTGVQNWFRDQVNPIGFWVYPACPGASVYVHAHVVPEISSLSDTVLDFDTDAAILANYVVYRAYSKEDEVGAAQRALAYYQAFAEALK